MVLVNRGEFPPACASYGPSYVKTRRKRPVGFLALPRAAVGTGSLDFIAASKATLKRGDIAAFGNNFPDLPPCFYPAFRGAIPLPLSFLKFGFADRANFFS